MTSNQGKGEATYKAFVQRASTIDRRIAFDRHVVQMNSVRIYLTNTNGTVESSVLVDLARDFNGTHYLETGGDRSAPQSYFDIPFIESSEEETKPDKPSKTTCGDMLFVVMVPLVVLLLAYLFSTAMWYYNIIKAIQ